MARARKYNPAANERRTMAKKAKELGMSRTTFTKLAAVAKAATEGNERAKELITLFDRKEITANRAWVEFTGGHKKRILPREEQIVRGASRIVGAAVAAARALSDENADKTGALLELETMIEDAEGLVETISNAVGVLEKWIVPKGGDPRLEGLSPDEKELCVLEAEVRNLERHQKRDVSGSPHPFAALFHKRNQIEDLRRKMQKDAEK